MFRHITTSTKLLMFIIFFVMIDLVTKYIFVDLQRWNNIILIQATLNTGSARSLPVPKYVSVTLGIGMIGYLYFLYKEKKIWLRSTILFISWIIGNSRDRILLWWVRDFISIGTFPIFNIADILLCCAVAIIIRQESNNYWLWTKQGTK
jgi:signal peptidase II